MRGVQAAAVATAALTVIGSVSAATPAHASNYGVELTGTWLVSSNGDCAKTNDVFMNEQSNTQTWTVVTNCASAIECTGTVKSDQGWTGTIRLDNFWYVDHDIPNWAPCPDGTFASGHQLFVLWGVDTTTEERITTNINYMGARNITKTASGSCGANKPLVIEIPAFLKKLS
jgi:hypothetical protein